MKKNLFTKILITIAYFAVIYINYLANALPIGGMTTGELSDAYPNLFTPAGVTFSIWGLIYLLLFVYVIYSWGFFDKNRDIKKEEHIHTVDKIFILNALANISWIFAWHYRIVSLALIIMFCILGTLIYISKKVNYTPMSISEKICLHLPFTVYFGWISVATIANITVFFVDMNWIGTIISDQLWTIIALCIGLIAGSLVSIKDKNFPYILVFIWAYCGILLKHTSENGFANQYPNIITTVIVCISIFIGTTMWISFCKKK